MNTPLGFHSVIEYFKQNGWGFHVDETRPILHAGFKGKNGNFRCLAVVDESDDLLQVFTSVPVVVSPPMRGAAAELCIRLSYGMKMGKFELSFEDGELRFHTCSAYPKGDLNDEVIRRVLGLNLVMTDQHFPAFIAVIYANVAPAEAVRQIRFRLSKGEVSRPEPKVLMRSRISLN